MTTINPSNQTITQYYTQSGDANNLNNNIAPGTSGQILISNGGSSQATFQNAPSIGGFTSIKIQVFSSHGSHTYTPTAGMSYCIVEVIGGGGGGGSSANGVFSVGSGGGAGGYSREIFDAATIGASQSLTIGTGGTPTNPGTSTLFGALITCTGGGGGINVSVQNTPTIGGAGGTVTVGGTFNVGGGAGGIGMWVTAGDEYAGYGGNSFLAPGGYSGNTLNTPGGAGQYGSGGGGGFQSQVGGNGADGLVLVTEFIA